MIIKAMELMNLQAYSHLIFLFSTLLFSQSIDLKPVRASSLPIQALVAPITKDAATSLYTLSLSRNEYLLDLSGPLLWSPCSPTHPTIPCSSGEYCAAAAPGAPNFHDSQCTCTARPTNPVTGDQAIGDLTLTDVDTNATDGNTPTAELAVHGVVSSCAPDSLLRSLPRGVTGDAGLGRGSLLSLPAQLYGKLSLSKRQFAICLPSTATAPGVAFFGGGPYGLMPPTQFDAGAALSYTDLVRDPMRTSTYSIRLRGIAVNQEAVPLPAGALDRGGGGVTLDTALPYTVMRRDVYRPFVDAFQRSMAHVPRMPSQQQCAAYPYNPVTWRCAAARLAHTRLVANTTDGANPLRQVSVRAVAACAPRKLLARLPRDAAGVAGLAASGLALPAQVAASQRVAGKFLLCLPRNAGGEGIAIFGGGPLFLMTSTAPPVEVASDFTSSLTYTPLVSRRGSSSYYLAVTAIAVDKAPVGLPKDALAGGGGVVLGTTAAYTELRPDVYWPVVGAFDRALRRSWNNTKRVAAVAPFELCYDSKTLPGPTRIGWLVPEIVLMLEGGRKTNWTFGGLNTMVDVNGFTAACFGFLKMKPEKDGGYGGKPAVVLGGFQMEDHVLQFDLEKRRLGFARLPVFTSCSNFNFTRKG
ncbi:hypothetical protein HU200_009489 [Digitaria exilis]|uniref:Peptidase A1 domain-containing protein n=1 Tax=Digitaria exilis TaxID=1010633 RepID=A0A835FM30_9POAL|nr:hypothetical protein HU200_009489 [Digitaria exilis]